MNRDLFKQILNSRTQRDRGVFLSDSHFLFPFSIPLEDIWPDCNIIFTKVQAILYFLFIYTNYKWANLTTCTNILVKIEIQPLHSSLESTRFKGLFVHYNETFEICSFIVYKYKTFTLSKWTKSSSHCKPFFFTSGWLLKAILFSDDFQRVFYLSFTSSRTHKKKILPLFRKKRESKNHFSWIIRNLLQRTFSSQTFVLYAFLKHRYHDRRRNAPTMEHRKKAATFAATMVDPTGVPARIDTNIPISAQTTDSTTEQTVTERKLLKFAHL